MATLIGIYKGSTYGSSATVPSGLTGAVSMVAVVGSFTDRTEVPTMSGWTSLARTDQRDDNPSSTVNQTVNSAFKRAYAAGTYSVGSATDYLLTIYVYGGTDTAGIIATANSRDTETPQVPFQCVLPSVTAGGAGALVVGATCWTTAPTAITPGTWSSAQPGASYEQTSWYRSVTAGATGTVTISHGAQDVGGGILIFIPDASGPSNFVPDALAPVTTGRSTASFLADGLTPAIIGAARAAFVPQVLTPSLTGPARATFIPQEMVAVTTGPASATAAFTPDVLVAVTTAPSRASFLGSPLVPIATLASMAAFVPTALTALITGPAIAVGTNRKLIVIGDSLSRGFKVGGFESVYGFVKSSGLVTSFSSWDIRDFAISGSWTQQYIDTYWPNDIEPIASAGDVLLLFQGVNGIWVAGGGNTPIQEVDALEELCDLARAKGLKIVILGALQQDATSQEQQDIDDFNDELRTRALTFADKYIDIYTLLPQFMPAGVPNAYFSDAVHLNDSGYLILLNLIIAQLRDFLGFSADALVPVTTASSTAVFGAQVMTPTTSAVARAAFYGSTLVPPTILPSRAVFVTEALVALSTGRSTASFTPEQMAAVGSGKATASFVPQALVPTPTGPASAPGYFIPDALTPSVTGPARAAFVTVPLVPLTTGPASMGPVFVPDQLVPVTNGKAVASFVPAPLVEAANGSSAAAFYASALTPLQTGPAEMRNVFYGDSLVPFTTAPSVAVFAAQRMSEQAIAASVAALTVSVMVAVENGKARASFVPEALTPVQTGPATAATQGFSGNVLVPLVTGPSRAVFVPAQLVALLTGSATATTSEFVDSRPQPEPTAFRRLERVQPMVVRVRVSKYGG